MILRSLSAWSSNRRSFIHKINRLYHYPLTDTPITPTINILLYSSIRNKMSHPRRLRTLQATHSQSKEQQRIESGVKSPLHRLRPGSRLLEEIRCHTEGNLQQQQKDGLYNRNITHFRDSFKANDSSALPFLSSLRCIKDYRQQYPSLHIERPWAPPLSNPSRPPASPQSISVLGKK
jgi:hypothetical protein